MFRLRARMVLEIFIQLLVILLRFFYLILLYFRINRLYGSIFLKILKIYFIVIAIQHGGGTLINNHLPRLFF